MHEFQKSKILYTGVPPKRQRKFFAKPVVLGLVFGLVAAMLCGLFYVLRLPRFRIQEVSVHGAESVSEEKVREAVTRRLAGKFFFIPNDSLFFVSSHGIEQELLKEFPRLAAVEVKKTFAPSLEVASYERSIWGIGCTKTELMEVRSDEKTARGEVFGKAVGPCFYIDSGGFAFDEVSSFEGQLLPVLYKDGEGVRATNIFQKGDIDFFDRVSHALSDAFELPLLSAEFSGGAPGEARLGVKEGWSIIVSRERDIAVWISVLRTLLSGEIKERRTMLDYVDLRFGNKVFYKFRN